MVTGSQLLESPLELILQGKSHAQKGKQIGGTQGLFNGRDWGYPVHHLKVEQKGLGRLQRPEGKLLQHRRAK